MSLCLGVALPLLNGLRHQTGNRAAETFANARIQWAASPIADPDFSREPGESPMLQGVGLPQEVLDKVYYENAERVLRLKD